MGWTGIYDWYTGESNLDILKREYFSRDNSCELVKSSQRGGHVWFMYRKKRTDKKYVSVTMCKRYQNNHEFCYKEMGLSSGPYFYDMPKSWLKDIKDSYVGEEYAEEWIKNFMSGGDEPKEKYPVWSKVPFGTRFKMTFKHDMTSGHKAGDTVEGKWTGRQLVYSGYGCSKNCIKKYFSVEEIK